MRFLFDAGSLAVQATSGETGDMAGAWLVPKGRLFGMGQLDQILT